MSDNASGQNKSGLTLDEIIEEAMTHLDFGPEVMICLEPDGFFCDMKPEELELARASIVFLGYRLLLMYRLKRSNARESSGGWVAYRHFRFEIYKEIAGVLEICGTEDERIDEVRRLYKVASSAEDEDEAYREKIHGIMEDFEERYGLDAENIGIVFI